MEARELIHKGLYQLGSEVVKFNALNGCVYEPTCKFSFCIGKVYEDAETGKLEVRTENGVWEELQPIPLTAEILEMNGFVLTDDFYSTEDGIQVAFESKEQYPAIFVSQQGIGKSYMERIYPAGHIISVHELQRALRCCGLWYLAENFKV